MKSKLLNKSKRHRYRQQPQLLLK